MSTEVRELKRELQVLRASIANIEDTLRRLEINGNKTDEATTTADSQASKDGTVRDRDGNVIAIGCLVQFLTQGKISSTRGRIYKISSNGERATARDSFGNSVSRAPHNLRVIAYNG